MRHRQLGRTGVQIPELGFGTWEYRGGPEPLRRAFELGALLVDTAESYGSEEVVGEAARGLRDRLFIASKVSPRNFRPADIRKAADASLRRLNTDRLDLYQLHFPNYNVPLEETLGAMEDLVDAGKVRFIGVSNFLLPELKRAQRAMRRHPLVANQLRYSLVDRSIERGLLEYCQREGITVIAYSPLAENFRALSKRDPEGALERVAGRRGKTVPQVALNWCLRPAGVVAIPKASSIPHVEDDCGASGWELSPEDADELRRSVRFRQRGRWLLALHRLAHRARQRWQNT